MRIEPSGIVMAGVCQIQTEHCVARSVAPITAVWTFPSRLQVNVCRPCLEEEIRAGKWRIESVRLKMRADICVYDAADNLQLIVEVKKLPTDSSIGELTWGRRMHRNLFAHNAVPLTPYLMIIIFPSSFSLWDKTAANDPGAMPRYRGSIVPFLEPYIDDVGTFIESSSESQVVRIVAKWLDDVTKITDVTTDNLAWLPESGLFNSIHFGRVEIESNIRIK